jgi:hypothetical protein
MDVAVEPSRSVSIVSNPSSAMFAIVGEATPLTQRRTSSSTVS